EEEQRTRDFFSGAEEQRTSTSRGTKNQHQQKNKEPALAEEMRAK
ncbi:hypothetical protein Gogos_019335, partial [Gossypium gossypioides]|nr:hypothetical protein [Gossypium gossypioides]